MHATNETLDPSEGPLRHRPGDVIAERYAIIEQIGSGGSGIVYAVRDLRDGSRAALKILRPDRFSPTAAARFRREAAIMQNVRGPHLLRILDFGEERGAAWFAMELVAGSLRDRIARGPLPIEMTRSVAVQVLRGLETLHQQRIIHRDVKPANILIDGHDHAWIADFGVARAEDDTHLTGDDPVLTFAYAAPEQLLGQEVDARADLYAVGVVLYEMLTGTVPLRGRSRVGTAMARAGGRVPDVRTLRPEVPAWLAAVIARLLEREPVDRYGSAAAVLADIERETKPAGRGRRRLAAIAVVCIVAALGSLRRTSPALPRIVEDPEWGVHAVDERGRSVWARSDIGQPMRWALVRRGGERPLIATVLQPTGSSKVHRLTLLDPNSGRVVDSVALPPPVTEFASYSPTFNVAQLAAGDIDGDGWDEVVLVYVHDRYWPCYAVVCDLRRRESRVIFEAGGHHLVGAIADLDGDGRKEVIFAGINNRMGWNDGVAAVSLPIGSPQLRDVCASTPDTDYRSTVGKPLRWYALTPPGVQPWQGRITVDPERRILRVIYNTRPAYELSFDGFSSRDRSTLGTGRRQAVRDAACKHGREATRLLEGSFVTDAMREIDAGIADARTASDARLVEWLSRVRARVLVALGRTAEANTEFAAGFASAEVSSNVAWDAARAFHLHGDLAEAVRWYRRGIERGSDHDAGRFKWEFLEGSVLALGEMGSWNEAIDEVGRYHAVYPFESFVTQLRAYALWRSGTPPPSYIAADNAPDLFRYASLEVRFANGEDGRALLAEVARQRTLWSSSFALLDTLEGEIRESLGDREGALRLARRAFAAARTERLTDPEVRAHFGLIAERYTRMAAAAGLTSEAATVRRQIAEAAVRGGNDASSDGR